MPVVPAVPQRVQVDAVRTSRVDPAALTRIGYTRLVRKGGGHRAHARATELYLPAWPRAQSLGHSSSLHASLIVTTTVTTHSRRQLHKLQSVLARLMATLWITTAAAKRKR